MKSDSKSWKDLEKALPPSMSAVVTAQAALLPSKASDGGATALGRAHTCLWFCLSVLLLPHLYSKCSRRRSGAGITWGLSEMHTCLLMEPQGCFRGAWKHPFLPLSEWNTAGDRPSSFISLTQLWAVPLLFFQSNNQVLTFSHKSYC